MLRGSGGGDVLPVEYTVASLPSPTSCRHKFAWVTDQPSGPGLMFSDGSTWSASATGASYTGTTNASGDFTVVFATPYATTPNIQPVCYPPADSTTRIRVTVASTTGFTVHTEQNPSVTVATISVLAFGTVAVPNVPVRVLVY